MALLATYIRLLSHCPALAKGGQILLQARIGAFVSGKWLAQARLIKQQFAGCCPFCPPDLDETLKEPDTLLHALLRCARWTRERDLFIQPLLDSIVDVGNLSDEDKVILLLGGRIAHAPHEVDGWAGPRPSAITKDYFEMLVSEDDTVWTDDSFFVDRRDEWLTRMRDAQVDGNNVAGIVLVPCLQVARYFQSIDPARQAVFTSPTIKRADAPTGTASLGADEVILLDEIIAASDDEDSES